MKEGKFSRNLPWLAVLLTVTYLVYAAWPVRDKPSDWHFHQFGTTPALADGRFKPMDTVARTNLLLITHRQSFYNPDNGQRLSANKWMLDAMTTPIDGDPLEKFYANGAKNRPAWKYKVFRIENDELLRALSLKMRDGLRYSIDELEPFREYLDVEARRIDKVPARDRSLLEAKLFELYQHLQIYLKVARNITPLLVPAEPDENGNEQWQSFRHALGELIQQGGVGPDNQDTADTVKFYLTLLTAYDRGDREEFNAELGKHLAKLETQSPSLMQRMKLEVYFNDFAPFYHCLAIYVFIAIAAVISWVGGSWSRSLRTAAFASMAVVFVVHTAALIMRMYLQNRPPVTNLYSSAVFIGWGCVLMCLILEWFFRYGIGIVVGAVTGFCTLIIAHWLSLSGDTMEMMQAVLDTNFWLATHVTMITLGYSTTFVAGMAGIAYIVLGVFTNMLRNGWAANLNRMTYGILCAGMFLSFVGTVLGGIWADQSWGRFWGWDPKENGALLIVIWIALILHARWAGMVKPRGIAVLSVLGIIVTSWSWFGTNFLGYGLHSYGHRDGAMVTLLMIDFVFLSIALLGAFLPLQMWQSFRPVSVTPSAQPPLRPRPSMA